MYKESVVTFQLFRIQLQHSTPGRDMERTSTRETDLSAMGQVYSLKVSKNFPVKCRESKTFSSDSVERR